MPAVTLHLRRTGGGAPRFERHEVEVGGQASVLDALLAVQRQSAPDLAFRYSCRVGMCGSCAVVVNGRERLACAALVRTIGNELRVEPLRNLPVVRDLAADMTPFFDAYQRSLPHFHPRADLEDFHRLPHDSAEWQALNHQPQCIDCGACWSACSLVTMNPRYLGPMALNRALSLLVDPRDGAKQERLARVAGEDGAFRCHTLGNCRETCPRGISPTQSIERLKRLALGAQVRRWLARLLGKAAAQ
ncbi:MAG: succinate dehydrogenase/fumarate reductase iron-sulfur subunit [Verrucomicrobia bacterium]|nr:succinate dehydrogenase/fumarate reductase iron-sulfur subunit [Verrucomicrobiota bacterium]